MASQSIGRRDPLPAFCFKVSLDINGEGAAEAFFRNVQGIKYETEVLDVKAGGVNDTTFQLPGSTKWAHIVLKRGFTGDSGFLAWRESWLDPGSAKTRIKFGTIVQLDTELKPRATWTLEEAWPVKWEISEFDASKPELSIETLELAHHGLRRTG